MSTDLPPRPWSYSTKTFDKRTEGQGFLYLHDATGRKIGTLWGRPHEKIAMAKEIVERINGGE